MEFTKAEKKDLRELASSVYEAEVRSLLEELDEQFSRWRSGEILSSALLDEIHEFHQHPSRELWSMYQGLSESMIVERGIALGFIDQSALSPALRAKLNPEYFSRARRLSED